MNVPQEPVRGAVLDPSVFSLPGIEIVRALNRRLVPMPPMSHLMGLHLAQFSAGAATATLPLSPWLIGLSGQVEPSLVAVPAMTVAVQTTVGPGIDVIPLMHSMNYARPASPDSDMLVARARVLHTRRTLALAEAVVEDTRGRLIAHATGALRTPAIDPPPRPLASPLAPVAEPTFPTPDPYLRPLPPGRDVDVSPFIRLGGMRALGMLISGELPRLATADLWGMEQPDFTEGRATMRVRTSPWFCNPFGVVDEGVIALFASAAVMTADATLLPAGRAIAALDIALKYIRRVRPDDGELVARANVLHHEDDFLVTSVEVLDEEGRRVALGTKSAMFVVPRERPRAAEPEHVLATVLFTDIVGSTERAAEVGDARWRALLEEHNTIVRKELANFRGREVKMTGDGVLATFDSPTRALQCVRAIRDDLTRLGLAIYAGLHTGETEILGNDIGGLAVNVASRILEEAEPGEILASGTVRELASGSGVRFADRGMRALKGVPGEVHLYAVDG